MTRRSLCSCEFQELSWSRSSQAPVWFSALASLHFTVSVFSHKTNCSNISIRDSVLLSLTGNVNFKACEAVLFLAVTLTSDYCPSLKHLSLSSVLASLFAHLPSEVYGSILVTEICFVRGCVGHCSVLFMTGKNREKVRRLNLSSAAWSSDSLCGVGMELWAVDDSCRAEFRFAAKQSSFCVALAALGLLE